MEILFFLVPLALLLSGVGLALFFGAVATGQFEDLDGDGARFLLEPSPSPRPAAASSAERSRCRPSRS